MTEQIETSGAIIDVAGQPNPHEDAWIRLDLAGAITLRDILSRLIEHGADKAATESIELFDSNGEQYDLHVKLAPTTESPSYDPKNWVKTHYSQW